MSARRRRVSMWAMAAAALGALAACGPAATPPSSQAPASVVAPHGSNLGEVVLQPGAAAKLGLETEPIRDAAPIGVDFDQDAPPRVLVPLSAVIYDIDGTTSVFVNSAPRTYVREKVVVADVVGDDAVLQSGPRVGAAIVTIGAVELLGAEKGVPGEQ
jgi:hypothetical protein